MDNKTNTTQLQKVIALMLAVCIGVGLLSSTAIRLVATTYYAQNQRKLVTGVPVVDKIIDAVTDGGSSNSSSTPSTTAPSTTSPSTAAPSTTAPTTKPADDAGDSGSDDSGTDILGTITDLLGSLGSLGDLIPDLGGSSGGDDSGDSDTPATPDSTHILDTDSAQTIQHRANILNKYNIMVNATKVAGVSCTSVTYRSIEKDIFTGTLLHNIEKTFPDYFISKDNSAKAPIIIDFKPVAAPEEGKLPAKNYFLINNNSYASMLKSDEATVKEAISRATDVEIEGGLRKLTIILKDQKNPAVTEQTATEAASFTSAMFPVISADVLKEKVNSSLLASEISEANVTYTGCTVEVIYNPAFSGVIPGFNSLPGKIVSITQTTRYTGEFKGKLITSSGTVTEITEYTDFVY